MTKNTLLFQNSFPEILKTEAEKVLGLNLEIGQQFKSVDSYSFLLSSNSQKYVGKIFKNIDWPPRDKMESVYKLLDKYNIEHEEVVYSDFDHEIFKFGWTLSKYIPGGTIGDLRDKGELNYELYLKQVGKVLKEVHKIELDKFGSIQESNWRFDKFSGLIESELKNADLEILPKKYVKQKTILEKGKKWAMENRNKYDDQSPVIVHNDINKGNVMWNNGELILIDWVDSLSAIPLRDFATLTFREDREIIGFLEEGYGQTIDREELKFHQVIRFLTLSNFYFNDRSEGEFLKMVERLELLLEKDEAFGTIQN